MRVPIVGICFATARSCIDSNVVLEAFGSHCLVLDGVATGHMDGAVAQDDMPFGGVGDSGIGGYHGHEGFLTFSHGKSVHKRGFINSSQFIYPPHGRLMHKLIYKFILR